MKLKFNVSGKSQADPFIFLDDDIFYLYVTGINGVEAYSTNDIFGEWTYQGVVTKFKVGEEFWAPSVMESSSPYSSKTTMKKARDITA